MKFPLLKESDERRAVVPALFGGLNLREALNLVEDSQLTDCENMWWKDGALSTRPGIAEKMAIPSAATDAEQSGAPRSEFSPTQVTYVEDGKTYCMFATFDVLYSASVPDEAIDGGTALFRTAFMADDGTIIKPANLAFASRSFVDKLILEKSYFAFAGSKLKGCGIFALFGVKTLQGEWSYGTVYELQSLQNGAVWERVNDDDLYTPTVLQYLKGNNYSQYTALPTAEKHPEAASLEGVNLLNGRGKALFFTDGKSTQFSFRGSISNKKVNPAPIIKIRYTGAPIGTANLTDVTWIIDSIAGSNGSATVNGVKAYASTSFKTLSVWFEADGNTFVLPLSDLPNNLEVTFYCTPTEKQESLFTMSCYAWFGGSSEQSGGSRLFVGGGSKEGNLVRWSEPGKQLYFAESSYAYVGDKSGRITAFAKQDKMLVMFKEFELYGTAYSALGKAAAKEVYNNQLPQDTEQLAIPITQLHGAIGCDCPATIQLCNNRLIWATTNKKIYTLVSSSAFSETNVEELSPLVGRELGKFSPALFTLSSAADWNGYYILFLGIYAFVLDYAGRQTADKGSWYKWKTNLLVYCTVTSAENCCLMSRNYGLLLSNTITGTTDKLYAKTEQETEPTVKESPIYSMFQTKVFDFNRPDQLKSFRHLYLGVGNQQGEILLSFLTERGTTNGVRKLTILQSADKYTPQAAKTHRISVLQPRTVRFGIKAECNGVMSADSLILTYNTLGGVK